MERRRILHVFRLMQHGGAELRTIDVMRHVDRNRFLLEYCALSGLPGDLDDEIHALGGQVHHCRLGPTFGRRFRLLLRQGQFDVVHSHMHHFSGYILRLAAQERIPVRIAHFRNTSDGRSNTPRRVLQRRLMRHWIDRHATHILAVSKGTMSAAWHVRWSQDRRCRVIYNGLDLRAFANPPDPRGVRREWGLPDECPLYLHVGRMSAQKNQPRLASIFSEIVRRQPTAHLVLVGRGGNPTEKQLRAQIQELGVSERVVIAGVRRDVPRLLKAADAVILPSAWEGLPGVVLEACAAGTPVVGSDLLGIREIAAHFPSVRYLPLAARDPEWATTAIQLADRMRREGDRAAALAAFSRSLFAIDRCVTAHCAVWGSRPSQ